MGAYYCPHTLLHSLDTIFRRSVWRPHHRFISSREWHSDWSRRKFSGDMEHVTVGAAASEVVVGDPLSLQAKISSISNAGTHKLQVIADFDATLTRFWIDGRRGQSSHGLLQQGNPEFDERRQKLYEYYHPLEFDPSIPLDKKAMLMEEWWGKTHGLLIEGGLTYDAIKTSVANANIAFRDGVVELLEFLEEKDVPILVFSAGLADIIEEVFRQKLHRSFKNVRIVSNRMIFDQNGQLVAFKGKTIHVLNKNEHALDMAAPVHDQIDSGNGPIEDHLSVMKRTNVLLLGDHIGDLGMSDGLDYETRISVGFLNHNIEDSLDSYQKAFDVLYLSSMGSYAALFNSSSVAGPRSCFKNAKYAGIISCRVGWSDRKMKQWGSEMEHIMAVDDVVVEDPRSIQTKVSSMSLGGPQKLQVIADFDATLTKYWVDGRRGQSSNRMLKQGNPEFDEKRKKLYEYYHSFEFNPTIPLDTKFPLMKEWWKKAHALLIKGGIRGDAIKTSVANANVAFREGVDELLEFLEKDVPVLVFSAGLSDIIDEVFKQKLNRSFKNVRILSNKMIFDKNGHLVAFKGKTIHALNKNEHMAADQIDEMKKRTNVLLLGDHIGDLGMSHALNYQTQISVGFLNDNIESSLDSYRKAFDVVYLNDASMQGALQLASRIRRPH